MWSRVCGGREKSETCAEQPNDGWACNSYLTLCHMCSRHSGGETAVGERANRVFGGVSGRFSETEVAASRSGAVACASLQNSVWDTFRVRSEQLHSFGVSGVTA